MGLPAMEDNAAVGTIAYLADSCRGYKSNVWHQSGLVGYDNEN